MPGLTLGDTIPNLQVETTHGTFKLHDLVPQNSYTIIFSHPGDFTPVCTTELASMAAYADKFAERGVNLLGFSVDDVISHHEWIKDIQAYMTQIGQHNTTGPGGKPFPFPIAADPTGQLIRELNMVDPEAQQDASSRRPVPSRSLHVIGGADKKIKLSFLFPGSTGRNMEEVLRAVDSLKKASGEKVATPANWKPGEPVVIAPSVSNDEAKQMFPGGFHTAQLPSGKEYLRFANA